VFGFLFGFVFLIETETLPEFFLGINNLLNKEYNGSVIPNALGERFFEPAPGSNLYGGLRTEY